MAAWPLLNILPSSRLLFLFEEAFRVQTDEMHSGSVGFQGCTFVKQDM